MASTSPKGGIPVWVLGAGVAVLVLVAGIVIWRAVNPGGIDNRATKSIRPGQYDFKAEIQKMQARDKSKAEAEKPMGGF